MVDATQIGNGIPAVDFSRITCPNPESGESASQRANDDAAYPKPFRDVSGSIGKQSNAASKDVPMTPTDPAYHFVIVPGGEYL